MRIQNCLALVKNLNETPVSLNQKLLNLLVKNLAQLPIMVLSSIHLAKQRLHTMPKMVHHKVPINLGSVEQTAITLLTGEILLHVPLQIITTTIKTTIIKRTTKEFGKLSLQPKLCKKVET